MKPIVHYPVWLLVICWYLPGAGTAADISSAQSGNWGVATTWAGGVVPTANDSVTILTGDTILLESGGKSCYNLTVENGGILYANNSSTGSNPRYIYIYGNIQCDGTIGNGSTYDLIGFNVEGDSCQITGSGTFDASRIRKYLDEEDTTTLIIRRQVTLRIGGTAIYNNRSGTVFQVIIDAGDTLNVAGDGTTPGNVAIDGINGAASSTGGGSITVHGTLLVSGILFLTTSNSSNPVSVTIAGSGLIETASISCPNSGTSGHTFTIEEDGVLNLISADWGEIGFVNNVYHFLPGSTVIYSGDTAQTIGNPTAYSHLTLSGNGTKRIQANMTIGGDLVIEPDAVLELGAGTAVTVSGNCSLSGAGCLVLKSPSDSSATASFIPLGSVNGTGTVHIERLIKKYTEPADSKYHLLSSPVANQEIQPGFVLDPPESGTDFYRWSEPEGTWINSKDATGSWNTSFQSGDDRHFISGRGYLVGYPNDEMKVFTGSLIAWDLSPSISCTEGDYEGFNLIGNPFSSALNAEIDTWSKEDVGNAVWVWDGEAGNYKSWNGSVGNLENGIIPAMQGFFVQAMGPAPSLTIPTSSRIHDTQVFYKEEVQKILHITLFQGTLNDGVTLLINDSSFAGYDPFQDVLKFYGAPHAPQLFWIEEDSYLSINVCPPKVSGLILPLGFIACANGLCRMQFSGQESFPDGEDLFLEDYQENQSINLRKEAEYKFQAEEGFNASRFAIRIGRPAGISGRLPHPLISISACQNRVILSGLEAIEGVISLKLYDLKGDLVQAEQVTETRQVIETNLPGGIYIVTLITPNDLFSKKIHLEPTSH